MTVHLWNEQSPPLQTRRSAGNEHRPNLNTAWRGLCYSNVQTAAEQEEKSRLGGGCGDFSKVYTTERSKKQKIADGTSLLVYDWWGGSSEMWTPRVSDLKARLSSPTSSLLISVWAFKVGDLTCTIIKGLASIFRDLSHMKRVCTEEAWQPSHRWVEKCNMLQWRNDWTTCTGSSAAGSIWLVVVRPRRSTFTSVSRILLTQALEINLFHTLLSKHHFQFFHLKRFNAKILVQFDSLVQISQLIDY